VNDVGETSSDVILPDSSQELIFPTELQVGLETFKASSVLVFASFTVAENHV